MKNFAKLMIIFGIGGILYGGIEVVFRNYTHWTMVLAGGVIFSMLYFLYGYIGKGHFILKCTLGCAIITTIEFIFGTGLNIILDMNVWDYSGLPFNLFGQICLLFSVGWFFISIPVSFLADIIRSSFRRIF